MSDASYIGHGGDTYGFCLTVGFSWSKCQHFCHRKSGLGLLYPSYVATCAIVKAVAGYRGISTETLRCVEPNPDPKFACEDMFGHRVCVPTYFHHGKINLHAKQLVFKCIKPILFSGFVRLGFSILHPPPSCHEGMFCLRILCSVSRMRPTVHLLSILHITFIFIFFNLNLNFLNLT